MRVVMFPFPAAGRRRSLGASLAITAALCAVPATAGVASAAPPPTTSATAPDLGTNVTVFDPSTPVAQIQATLDATYERQRDNEMGTARYAYLFKPGTYGTAD